MKGTLCQQEMMNNLSCIVSMLECKPRPGQSEQGGGATHKRIGSINEKLNGYSAFHLRAFRTSHNMR